MCSSTIVDEAVCGPTWEDDRVQTICPPATIKLCGRVHFKGPRNEHDPVRSLCAHPQLWMFFVSASVSLYRNHSVRASGILYAKLACRVRHGSCTILIVDNTPLNPLGAGSSTIVSDPHSSINQFQKVSGCPRPQLWTANIPR
jgi:hypothetical protein